MTIVGEMADFLLALPPRTQARLSAFVHLVENAQDVEAELDVCAHGTATLKLRHQPSTMPGAPRADPRTQQNHDRS